MGSGSKYITKHMEFNFSHIHKPLLMGILNATPDSFSDGGRFNEITAATQQCKNMLLQGADIIDVGGESSRPGSDSVAAEEQIKRVIPVIKSIREQVSETLLISIDTTLSAVANAALDAGANIINDISAGQGDAEMLALAAERQVPIILMHMAGKPKTMQENPYYDDVVKEILESLQHATQRAISAGIKPDNIAIDPGIGFGKRKQDNIDLMAHLDKIAYTQWPVLLGTSRKRFMGSICQVDSPDELVAATAVTTAIGVFAGVKMFRVHDVKENRHAIDISWEILNARNA